MIDRGKKARTETRVAPIAIDDLQLAGSKLEHALQQLHRLIQRANGHERPVHTRALETDFGGIAGDVDARKIVAQGDGEVRKGLVVEQPLVIGRVNVLDQTRLHEERLPLAFAGNEVEGDDLVEHGLLAAAEVGGWNEIAGHPIGKPQRLAYIEHASRGVLHQVDPGGVGKHVRLLQEAPEPLLTRFLIAIGLGGQVGVV